MELNRNCLQHFGTNHIENIVSIVTVKQCLDCCMHICWRKNTFTEQLPSDSLVIADMFTGHYQATYVPSHDHCIATAIHATIHKNFIRGSTEMFQVQKGSVAKLNGKYWSK
jgi:hypothetical protein